MSIHNPKDNPTQIDQLNERKHWESLDKARREATRFADVNVRQAEAAQELEALRASVPNLVGKELPPVCNDDVKFRTGVFEHGIVLSAHLFDKGQPMAQALDGRAGSYNIVMTHGEGANGNERLTEQKDNAGHLATRLVDKNDPSVLPAARVDTAVKNIKADLEGKESFSLVTCEIKSDKMEIRQAGEKCVVYVYDIDGSLVKSTKHRIGKRLDEVSIKKQEVGFEEIDLKPNQIVVVVDSDLSEGILKSAIAEAGGNLCIAMAKILSAHKNVADDGVRSQMNRPLNLSLYIHKPLEPKEAINPAPEGLKQQTEIISATRKSAHEVLNFAREKVQDLDPLLHPSREEVRSGVTMQERETASKNMLDPAKETAHVKGPEEKGFFARIAHKWRTSPKFLDKLDAFAFGAAEVVDVPFKLLSTIGKGINSAGEKTRELLISLAESRESKIGRAIGRVLLYPTGDVISAALGLMGTLPRLTGVIGSYATRLAINTVKDLGVKGVIGGLWATLSKGRRAARQESLEKVFNLEALFTAKPQLKALYEKLGEINPKAQMNLLRQLQEKNNEMRRTRVKREWDENHTEEKMFTSIDTFEKLRRRGVAQRSSTPRGTVGNFLVHGNEGIMVGPVRLRFPGFAHLALTRDLFFRRERRIGADGNFQRDSSGHIREDDFFDPSLARAVKSLLVQTDALADRWDAARRVDMSEDECALHPQEIEQEMLRVMAEFSDEAIRKGVDTEEHSRAFRTLMRKDDSIKANTDTEIEKLTPRSRHPELSAHINTLDQHLKAIRLTAVDVWHDTAVSTSTTTPLPNTPMARYLAAKTQLVLAIEAMERLKNDTTVINGQPTITAEIEKLISFYTKEAARIDEGVQVQLAIPALQAGDGNMGELLSKMDQEPNAPDLRQLLFANISNYRKALVRFQEMYVNAPNDAERTKIDGEFKTKMLTEYKPQFVAYLKTQSPNIDDTLATALTDELCSDAQQEWAATITQGNLDRIKANNGTISTLNSHLTVAPDQNGLKAKVAECTTATDAAYSEFLKNIATEFEGQNDDAVRASQVEFLVGKLKAQRDALAATAHMPAEVVQQMAVLHARYVRDAVRIASLRDRTVDTYNRTELLGSLMTGVDRSGWSEMARTIRDRFNLIVGKMLGKKAALAPSLSVFAVAGASKLAASIAEARVHEGVRDVIFSEYTVGTEKHTVASGLYGAIRAKNSFLGVSVPKGIAELHDKGDVLNSDRQLGNWLARVISNVKDGQGVVKIASELVELVPTRDANPTPAENAQRQEVLTAVTTALNRLLAEINKGRVAVKEDIAGSITSRAEGRAFIEQIEDKLLALTTELTDAEQAELRKERIIAVAGVGQAVKGIANAVYGGAKEMVLNPTATAVEVGASGIFMGKAMQADTWLVHHGVGLIQKAANYLHMPRLAAAYGAMLNVAEAPVKIIGSAGFDTAAAAIDRVTGNPVVAHDASPVQVLRAIGHQMAVDYQQIVHPGQHAQVAGHGPRQTPTHTNTRPNTPPHGTSTPAPAPTGTASGGTDHSGTHAPTDTHGQTPAPVDAHRDGERPALTPSTNANNADGFLDAGTMTHGNEGRGREGRMMAVLDDRYADLTDHERNIIANRLQNNHAVAEAIRTAHQGTSIAGDQIDVHVEGDHMVVRFHRPAGHGHAESMASTNVPLDQLLGNLPATEAAHMRAALGLAAAPTATTTNPPVAPTAQVAGTRTTATGTAAHGGAAGHGNSRHNDHHSHGSSGHGGAATGGHAGTHREHQGSHRDQHAGADQHAATAERSPNAATDTLNAAATTNLVNYLKNATTSLEGNLEPVADHPGRIHVRYGSPERSFDLDVQYHGNTQQAEVTPHGVANEDVAIANRLANSIRQVYATRHDALERLRTNIHQEGMTFGATERPNEIQVMVRNGNQPAITVVYAVTQRDNHTAVVAGPNQDPRISQERYRQIMTEINNVLTQESGIRQDFTDVSNPIENGDRNDLVDSLREALHADSQSDHDEAVTDARHELAGEEDAEDRPALRTALATAINRPVVEAGSRPGTIDVRFRDNTGAHTLTYRVTTNAEGKHVIYLPATEAATATMERHALRAIQIALSDGDEAIVVPASTASRTTQATSNTAPTGTVAATEAASVGERTAEQARRAADAAQNPEGTVRDVLGSLTAATPARTQGTTVTAERPTPAPTGTAPARPTPPTAAVANARTVTDTGSAEGLPENLLSDIDDNNDLPNDDDGAAGAAGSTRDAGPRAPRDSGSHGGHRPHNGGHTSGRGTHGGSRTGQGDRTPTRPAPTAEVRHAEVAGVRTEAAPTREPVTSEEVGRPSSLTIRQANIQTYNSEAAIQEHLRLSADPSHLGIVQVRGTGDHSSDRISLMTHPNADGSLRVIEVRGVGTGLFADDASHRNNALINRPLREVLASLSGRIAPNTQAAIAQGTDNAVRVTIQRTRVEAYNSEREAAARTPHTTRTITESDMTHEFTNETVGEWLSSVDRETRVATLRSDLLGSGYLMDQIRTLATLAERTTIEDHPWTVRLTAENILQALAEEIKDGHVTAQDIANNRHLRIPYNAEGGLSTPETQALMRQLYDIANYAGTNLRLTPQMAHNENSADEQEDRAEAHSAVDIDPEETYVESAGQRATAVIHALADISGDETITVPRDTANVDADDLIRTNTNTVLTESDIRERLDDLRRAHRTGPNSFDDTAFLADVEFFRQSGEHYMHSPRATAQRLEIPEGRNTPVAFADTLEHTLDERQKMAIRLGLALARERGETPVRAVAGMREAAAREAAPRDHGHLVTTLSPAERTFLHSVDGTLPERADLQNYSLDELHRLEQAVRDRVNHSSAIPTNQLALLGRVMAVAAERELLNRNANTIAQQVAARINAAHQNNPEMIISADRIRDSLLQVSAGAAFNNFEFRGAGVGISQRLYNVTSDNGRHTFSIALDLGVAGARDGADVGTVGVGGGVHANYNYRITRGLDAFVSGGVGVGGGITGINGEGIAPAALVGGYLAAGLRGRVSNSLDLVGIVSGSASLLGVNVGAVLGLQYNPAHHFEGMMRDLQAEVGATISPDDNPPFDLQQRVVERYGISREENRATILANREEVARRYRSVYQGLQNTALEDSVHNGISGGGFGIGLVNGLPTFGPYIRLTFGAGMYYEIRQAPDGQLHRVFHDAFQEAVRTAAMNESNNGTNTYVTRVTREVVAPQLGTDVNGQTRVISGTGHIRETVLGATSSETRERAVNAALAGARIHLTGNRISINDPVDSVEYRIMNFNVPGLTVQAAQDGRSATLHLPSTGDFSVVRIHVRGLAQNGVAQDEREVIVFCNGNMSTNDIEHMAEDATFRTRDYVAIEHLRGQPTHFYAGEYDTRDTTRAPVSAVAGSTTAPQPSDLPTANRDSAMTDAEAGRLDALDANVAPADLELENAVYEYFLHHNNYMSTFSTRSEVNGRDPATIQTERMRSIYNLIHNQRDFSLRGREFSPTYQMNRLLDKLTDAANLTDIAHLSLVAQHRAMRHRLTLGESHFAAVHPLGDAAAEAGLRASTARLRERAAHMNVRVGEEAVAGLVEYTPENLRQRGLEMSPRGSRGYIVVGRTNGGFSTRVVPGGAAVLANAEHFDLQSSRRDGEAMTENDKAMVRMFLRETYSDHEALAKSSSLFDQMLTGAERSILQNVEQMRNTITRDTLGRMPASSHSVQQAAVEGALAHNQQYQALITSPEYVRLAHNREVFATGVRQYLERGVDHFNVNMPGNRTYTIRLHVTATRGTFVVDGDPHSHPNRGHCGNDFVSTHIEMSLVQEAESEVPGNRTINMDMELPQTATGILVTGNHLNLGASNSVESSQTIIPPDHHQGGRRPDHTPGGNIHTSDTPPPNTNAGSSVDTYGAPSHTAGSGTQPGATPQSPPASGNSAGAGVDTY